MQTNCDDVNGDNDTSKVDAGSSWIEAEVRFLCCIDTAPTNVKKLKTYWT